LAGHGVEAGAVMSSNRLGEFRSRFTTHADQNAFLSTISRVYPKFWQDLRDTVLPNLPANISMHSIRRGYRDPALSPIRPSFAAWTQSFNIESVSWLQKVALRTLRAWTNHPAMRGFDPGATAEWTGEPVQFSWDPSLESAPAFLKRVREQVKTVADSRTDKSPDPLNRRHAEWLILYQFAGLSPRQIQQRDAGMGRFAGTPEDASVIRKGYKAVADRLGIPLRKPNRGRARDRKV
jgi:hypothetical protein